MITANRPLTFQEEQQQIDQEIDIEISKVSLLIGAKTRSGEIDGINGLWTILGQLQRLKAENLANHTKYTV